ncbi:hypothetical protein ACI3PK_13380, partial [Lactococcus cremoris]
MTKKHPDTDEAIIFSEWKKVKSYPSKVEWTEFTFASLFGENVNVERGISEGQLSLFDFDGDGIDDIEETFDSFEETLDSIEENTD